MCTGQGPPRPRAAGRGPGAQEPDCTWQQPVQAEPCPHALSPRPGRVLFVSFVPAEGGASAPVGAGVCHQVLPVIRSRSTVVATEQPLSTRGRPAGCVAKCLCCGPQGLDPRERPRPSPLIVRGAGVQEGALCHVTAPGSASRPLPASGSSAPPGPHGALPLCWRIAKITVLRFAAPRIAAPAHFPAWGAWGCSTLHSPFLYLRHYWEGTHDSHLSPKIF